MVRWHLWGVVMRSTSLQLIEISDEERLVLAGRVRRKTA